jgi:hypothetical protein
MSTTGVTTTVTGTAAAVPPEGRTAQPHPHHHDHHGHGHGHDNDDHDHQGHQHQHDPNHPPLGANPVLDIGGTVGALLVHLPGNTATSELHIRPAGDPAGQFHTGVHRRTTGGTERWVALFCEVEEGTYELLDDDGTPTAEVVVTGGHVAQADLR